MKIYTISLKTLLALALLFLSACSQSTEQPSGELVKQAILTYLTPSGSSSVNVTAEIENIRLDCKIDEGEIARNMASSWVFTAEVNMLEPKVEPDAFSNFGWLIFRKSENNEWRATLLKKGTWTCK